MYSENRYWGVLGCTILGCTPCNVRAPCRATHSFVERPTARIRIIITNNECGEKVQSLGAVFLRKGPRLHPAPNLRLVHPSLSEGARDEDAWSVQAQLLAAVRLRRRRRRPSLACTPRWHHNAACTGLAPAFTMACSVTGRPGGDHTRHKALPPRRNGRKRAELFVASTCAHIDAGSRRGSTRRLDEEAAAPTPLADADARNGRPRAGGVLAVTATRLRRAAALTATVRRAQ